MASIDPIIEQLFAGVGASGTGESARRCEDQGGTVRGDGPACEIHSSERAESDIFNCYFDATYLALQDWSPRYKECCRYADAELVASVAIEDDEEDTDNTDAINLCMNALVQELPVPSTVAQLIRGNLVDACGSLGDEKSMTNEFAESVINALVTGGVDYSTRETRRFISKSQECCKSVSKYTDNLLSSKCFAEAAERYQELIRRIPEECGCNDCAHIYDASSPPGGTERERPDTTTDPRTVVPNRREVRTSSNYGFIPKIFGRYVTSGNVIWVDNPVTRSITFVRDNGEGVLSEVTESLTTVSFIVGLCSTVVKSLLRVWSGDTLIYNDSVSFDEDGYVKLTDESRATTDIDVSFMASSSYSMERLEFFRPKISLHSSPPQRVLELYARSVGFGRAPAHRDLTYVLFTDIDVSLFGSSFPNLTFDVSSTNPSDILPITISPPTGEVTSMFVDPRTKIVHLKGEDVTHLLRYDTLQEAYPSTGPQKGYSLLSGRTLINDADGVVVINAYTGEELSTLPGGEILPKTRSFLGYDFSKTANEMLICSDENANLTIYRFDHNTDILHEGMPFSAPEEESLLFLDGIITQDSTATHYLQFCTSPLGTDQLVVVDYTVGATDGSLSFAMEYVIRRITLPWENFELRALTRDPRNNILEGVIFSPNDDAYFVFQISQDIAEESLTITPISRGVSGDLRRSGGGGRNWAIIDNDGFILSTNSSGEVTVLDNLVERDLPTVDGAQYYDGITDSITYTSNVSPERVYRVFLNKTVPSLLTMKELFDGLIQLSNLPEHRFDTTGLSSVTLEGFLIDSPTSLYRVFSDLSGLYLLSAIDDGSTVTFNREDSPGEIVDLDTSSVIKDSVSIVTSVVDRSRKYATASFVNIDDTGLIDIVQTATLDPELDTSIGDEVVRFNLNVNDRPENIRNYLEAALKEHLLNNNTINVSLMPRMARVTPQDRVREGGVVYRLRSQTLGGSLQTALEGRMYDSELFEFSVNMSAVSLNTAVSIPRTTYRPPYRPVILFLPALTAEDAITTNSTTQIVYTGVESPDRTLPGGVRFNFRIQANPESPVPTQSIVQTPFSPPMQPITNYFPSNGEEPSPLYTTRVHTEGLHSGRLLFPPVDHRPACFSLDKTSEMVIRFDHDDFLEHFVSVDPDRPYDIQETPRRNLLIVGDEYIQFAEYFVTGRTVTFRKLFRGNFGTEPYIPTHFAGERVYLYTPESFEKVTIDPYHTNMQATCRMWFQATLDAGVLDLEYAKRSDAGSARAWAPTDVKRQDDPFDPWRVNLTYKRRVPYHNNLLMDSGEYPPMAAQEVYYELIMLPGEEMTIERMESDFFQTYASFFPQPYLSYENDVWSEFDPVVDHPQGVAITQMEDRIRGYPAIINYVASPYPYPDDW